METGKTMDVLKTLWLECTDNPFHSQDLASSIFSFQTLKDVWKVGDICSLKKKKKKKKKKAHQIRRKILVTKNKNNIYHFYFPEDKIFSVGKLIFFFGFYTHFYIFWYMNTSLKNYRLVYEYLIKKLCWVLNWRKIHDIYAAINLCT